MTEKCRICLAQTNDLEFNVFNKLNEETTILEGLLSISSVKVLERDPLPQSICNQCYINLDQCYVFRTLIISSDKELKEQANNNNVQHNHQDLIDLTETEIKETDRFSYLGQNELEENDNTDSFGENFEKVKSESSYLGQNELEGNNKTDSFGENFKEVKSEFDGKPLNECDNINQRSENNIQEIPITKRNIKLISKKCKFKNSKLERKHECLECGKIFKRTYHLNVHIAYKHSEKQFKCDICNKKFARKYDLTYHSRVHTGEKPFTCELCGKSFASSSYFYVHKRMHTGQRKMKCNICQSSFISSDHLQIHIRQKHTGERPYLCELCSLAFTSSSALFRHKRDVHGEKVECPVCRKLYSTRALKDHIRRHKEREEGIKRFDCNLCGKRFTCATSKKRHLVIHSGEKAFKCEVCEKAFNQRSTLQTHMRIHSQVMPFQCEICSKSFRYKHHVKLHLEKHHKGDLDLGSKITFLYKAK